MGPFRKTTRTEMISLSHGKCKKIFWNLQSYEIISDWSPSNIWLGLTSILRIHKWTNVCECTQGEDIKQFWFEFFIFNFLIVEKYLSIYQLSLPIANIEYRISSLYAFSVLSPDLHFLQRQKYSGILKFDHFNSPKHIFPLTPNFWQKGFSW